MISWRARTHQQCDSAPLLTYRTKRGKSGTRRSPGVCSRPRSYVRRSTSVGCRPSDPSRGIYRGSGAAWSRRYLPRACAAEQRPPRARISRTASAQRWHRQLGTESASDPTHGDHDRPRNSRYASLIRGSVHDRRRRCRRDRRVQRRQVGAMDDRRRRAHRQQ